jgi:hypothetical protein
MTIPSLLLLPSGTVVKADSIANGGLAQQEQSV